jgi:uncharacterized membrane protein
MAWGGRWRRLRKWTRTIGCYLDLSWPRLSGFLCTPTRFGRRRSLLMMRLPLPFSVCLTVTLTPRERIRAVVQRQDVGRTVIFIFVIIVACGALFAVAFLIRSGKLEERHLSIRLLLALATVVLSWLLMHSVFGLRYAHKFYDDSVTGVEKHAGGLKFPEDDLPDDRDFAYFSFVIGMTCQVSDVNVTSREMRRLVLVHGILSFGFNTVILGLTINTVSSFL